MKIPNLFILGAPKCGTTSLTNWLNQHPEVFHPEIKEPYYFYTVNKTRTDWDEYIEIYKQSDINEILLYDASTSYLYGGVASNILGVQQEARFVVCLRNPIEMALSLHWQCLFSGEEKEKKFARAWRLGKERQKGNTVGLSIPDDVDPAFYAYGESCKLGAQVDRLLQEVPNDRVKFIFLEDLVQDAEGAFLDLCRWLGLKTEVEISYDVKNRAKVRRSKTAGMLLSAAGTVRRCLGIKKPTGILGQIHKLNFKEERYPEPSVELRKEMHEHFRSDIALLGELTKRDLSHWK